MRWLIDARPIAEGRGGVSRVARGLVSALAQDTNDNELILATTGARATSYELRAARHIHIPLPNKLWSAGCFLGALRLDHEIEKRAGKIDAVFLPNIGFVGNLKTPYVLLLHDLSFLIEPRWFTRKMQAWHAAVRAERLIRSATHLLSVSETTKRDAIRLLGIPEERITVIPIGPTLSEPPLTPPSKGGEQKPLLTKEGQGEVPSGRYVLALGANDPRKNAATAIAAVAALKRDPAFQDIELVLIGGQRQASDSELAALYANASAFLYPSWYEGYGLPLHEAAASGTPCIASTAGALPETAPPGTLFADPAKPQHWTEALRIALTHPRQPPHLPNAQAWKHAATILDAQLHLAATKNSRS